MCLSCEIDDKWPPFIEFVVWFLLQGLSVGNHLAVYVVLQTDIIDITNATYRNATIPNITTTISPSFGPVTLFTNDGETNGSFPLITKTTQKISSTLANNTNTSLVTSFYLTANAAANKTINGSRLEIDQTAEEQWASLLHFRGILLIFCIIGITLYVLHVCALLPYIVQTFRLGDPPSLKDSGNVFLRSRLKIHVGMLALETFIFDIPAGCLVMELLSLIWEGPLDETTNLNASDLILTLSLVGLAFIALYKGMMPLFLWIGNPLCFPCIPLRLLIVFPVGLVALAMTFCPIMGVAESRLLKFAPEVMQLKIGGLASNFFSIGMIFWGIFLVALVVGGCLWYKICYKGSVGDICSTCC